LAGARKIGRLRRTSAAEDMWHQLYLKMADDDPRGLLGAVIARDAAQVLRLSVIYALTDGSSEIDIDHLQAASAVWDYCRAGAAFIFGSSLGDPAADKLLQALAQAGWEGLTGAEQDRALGGRGVRVAREVLLRKGLALERVVQHGCGRPIKILVAAQFADNADQPE
jgi:hypothetical protein